MIRKFLSAVALATVALAATGANAKPFNVKTVVAKVDGYQKACKASFSDEIASRFCDLIEGHGANLDEVMKDPSVKMMSNQLALGTKNWSKLDA